MPGDEEPETHQRERPGDGRVEPEPGALDEQQSSDGCEGDRDHALGGPDALRDRRRRGGTIDTSHQRPAGRVEQEAEPAGCGERHERRTHDDRGDAAGRREPRSHTSDDAALAVERWHLDSMAVARERAHDGIIPAGARASPRESP
jgi:hypothetical protein